MVPVQGVSQEAFRFQLGQAAAGDVVPVAEAAAEDDELGLATCSGVAVAMGWIWVEKPAARRARSVSASQLVPGYFSKSA